MAGYALADIADRLDYPSAGAVAKAIRDEVARESAHVPAEDRASLLTLENDRLGYMLTRIWPQIEFGDLKAIDVGLKIITLHARLNQLDAVDAGTHTTQVLVVGGTESDYIRTLQGLTAATP